jgi:aminopeptidase YwaD
MDADACAGRSGSLLQDIKTLSAPNMEGRGDGSKGLTRAREILVHRYASLGLEPKGSNGFLQPFDIIVGAELTPAIAFLCQARVLSNR